MAVPRYWSACDVDIVLFDNGRGMGAVEFDDPADEAKTDQRQSLIKAQQ